MSVKNIFQEVSLIIKLVVTEYYLDRLLLLITLAIPKGLVELLNTTFYQKQTASELQLTGYNTPLTTEN